MGKEKEQAWGSRLGLILAMAGSAVGLANFLRFPIQVVENGGGAFIIPYLVCFVVMGVPLLWMEWAIGRRGGRFGDHSTPFMMDTMGDHKAWKYVGVFGIFNSMVVVSYYTYIESWSLGYMLLTIFGEFSGMNQDQVLQVFNDYTGVLAGTSIGYFSIALFLITLFINIFILTKGIDGIEKVAKIGMPLLLLFGILLAIKGLMLGTSGASEVVPDANAWDGINFLWEVEFSSVLDPKVWLAAAGQIFFTLGLGWGFIQSYASYMKSKEDIALTALASGFTNEFVEIVVGSLIIIPLAAGFLGMSWVEDNASFGMAFQTMPYLFDQLGHVLGGVAGVLWFGLLFFAGITSSLAMGMPWIGFMKDEFNWSHSKSTWTLGGILLILGLPAVLFYNYGVLDEYDYWVGTVALVIFAMLETILFSWVFKMDRGWKEITTGAEIKVPKLFRFFLRYVTPVLIIIVFIGALFAPEGNDWSGYLAGLFNGEPWEFDSGSIISKLAYLKEKVQLADLTDGAAIAELKQKILYSKIARVLIVATFALLTFLVYRAHSKRKKLELTQN